MTSKQKVVIEVSMKDAKARSKALKIVVGVKGVEGAAIKGEDRDQIEVTGEVMVMDSVKLTRLLRKKFCHVNLVSVGPVEKKDEKKEEKPVEYWPQYYYPIMPMRCYDQDPSCSIM